MDVQYVSIQAAFNEIVCNVAGFNRFSSHYDVRFLSDSLCLVAGKLLMSDALTANIVRQCLLNRTFLDTVKWHNYTKSCNNIIAEL